MNNSSTSFARLRARLVAVEHQHDPIGMGLQQADVRFAQRRAQHGHRVLEPILVGHDHVGIAFHHQRRAALSQGIAGQVEAIQQLALGKQRRFRRIDVLGRAGRAQLRQHPPADPHRPALAVVNREQQPALEAVERAAPLGRPDENADGFQDFRPALGLFSIRITLCTAAESNPAPAARSPSGIVRCSRP